MVAAFDERRQYLYRRLVAITGMRCVRPGGAFYVFPNIAAFGLPSLDFSARLLEAQRVAVVPGLPFGADGNVRLSYACSMTNIEEGVNRIERFVQAL